MKKAVTDRRVERYRDEKKKMQADRDIINSLMMGHTELTPALAGTIYYKMILQNIQFQSIVGEDFKKQVRQVLQEEGQNAVYLRIDYEKQKRHDKRLLARICKRTLLAAATMTLVLVVTACNWGTIQGWLTALQENRAQQEQTIEPQYVPAAAVQEAEPEIAESEPQTEETTDNAADTQKRSWMEAHYKQWTAADEELVTVTLQYGFANISPNITQLSVMADSTLDLNAIQITVDGGERCPLEEDELYVIDGIQYIFMGWYGSDVTQPKWDTETDTVSEDTTLYATWGRADAMADNYFKK